MKAPFFLVYVLIALVLFSCTEKATTSNLALKELSSIETFDKTYAHIVYFWFKDPSNEDDRLFF